MSTQVIHKKNNPDNKIGIEPVHHDSEEQELTQQIDSPKRVASDTHVEQRVLRGKGLVAEWLRR